MEQPAAETLLTDRLELRPLALADSAAIQAIFPRWEVVRHLAAGVPWPYPADGALTFVRDVMLPAVARGEKWARTIRRRVRAEQMIGAISLKTKPDHNRGFWLAPEWQGQGFMT